MTPSPTATSPSLLEESQSVVASCSPPPFLKLQLLPSLREHGGVWGWGKQLDRTLPYLLGRTQTQAQGSPHSLLLTQTCPASPWGLRGLQGKSKGPHSVKAELAKWLFSVSIAHVILSPTDAHGSWEASASTFQCPYRARAGRTAPRWEVVKWSPVLAPPLKTHCPAP